MLNEVTLEHVVYKSITKVLIWIIKTLMQHIINYEKGNPMQYNICIMSVDPEHNFVAKDAYWSL